SLRRKAPKALLWFMLRILGIIFFVLIGNVTIAQHFINSNYEGKDSIMIFPDYGYYFEGEANYSGDEIPTKVRANLEKYWSDNFSESFIKLLSFHNFRKM